MKPDATNQLSHATERCAVRQLLLGLLHCLPPSAAARARQWQSRAGRPGGLGWGCEDEKMEELEPGCGNGETIGIWETCGDMVEEVAEDSDWKDNSLCVSKLSAAASVCLGWMPSSNSPKQNQLQFLSQLSAMCCRHHTSITALKPVVLTADTWSKIVCSTHGIGICFSFVHSPFALRQVCPGYTLFTYKESEAFSGMPASGQLLLCWSCPLALMWYPVWTVASALVFPSSWSIWIPNSHLRVSCKLQRHFSSIK